MTTKGDLSSLSLRRHGAAKPRRRAERPLPGEMNALAEGEAEFTAGKTGRLDEVLRRLKGGRR